MNEFSVGKKRGEVHSKLKEIAEEIEANEGRKVEQIKRKIVAKTKGERGEMVGKTK